MTKRLTGRWAVRCVAPGTAAYVLILAVAGPVAARLVTGSRPASAPQSGPALPTPTPANTQAGGAAGGHRTKEGGG